MLTLNLDEKCLEAPDEEPALDIIDRTGSFFQW